LKDITGSRAGCRGYLSPQKGHTPTARATLSNGICIYIISYILFVRARALHGVLKTLSLSARDLHRPYKSSLPVCECSYISQTVVGSAHPLLLEKLTLITGFGSRVTATPVLLVREVNKSETNPSQPTGNCKRIRIAGLVWIKCNP